RAALDGDGPSIANAYVLQRLRGGRDDQLLRRLLRFVGGRTTGRFAGRLVPGLAILVNATGNERATRALADRASEHFGRVAGSAGSS
ncbi:MAG: hypothetical protein H0U79_08985, partial [Solirubrobacterales bacterium]|nr:hypothetical protein [Solirubrobacterales bacterium]